MTTTIEQTKTLCDAFTATVAAHASEPALRSADGAVDWTWRDYADRVDAAAAGLHGVGVRRGDTVALWLSNRPEFHVADTAAARLGAAPFSVYTTFTVEQAEHIVGDAGSRVLVTEPAFLEKALAVRARGATALELVVLVEGCHTEALTWDELLAAAPAGFDAAAAAAGVSPDDLATLIYTSGTWTSCTPRRTPPTARLLADHGLDAGPGYRAREDEVDAHPKRSELDGEGPHQSDEGPLAGGVRRAAVQRTLARRRSDHDDASPSRAGPSRAAALCTSGTSRRG